MKRLHFILFCSFGILCVLSFLLVFGSIVGTSERTSRVFERCSDLDPSGLKSEDLPLGNMERLIDRTKEILQFDDYFYREYRIGADSLLVYIVYWGQSDSNLKQTTGHNPDQCWVKSGGWKELQRSSGVRLLAESPRHDSANPTSNSLLPTPAQYIGPVEFRLLESPNASESYNVYYWQTWGGDVVPIRKSNENDFLNRMKRSDYWRFWEQKRKPLYFVRIHSKTPLAPVVSPTGMANSEGTMAEKKGSIGNENTSSIRHLPSAIDNDQHYLIDYPEVRELLRSIHKLTTVEELGADG